MTPPPPIDPDAIAALFALAVVSVTTITLTSIILRHRRSANTLPPSPDLAEIRDRLTRMEQAIDAIAIETERIAEGQRFTTRLLSEAGRVALPPAAGKNPAS